MKKPTKVQHERESTSRVSRLSATKSTTSEIEFLTHFFLLGSCSLLRSMFILWNESEKYFQHTTKVYWNEKTHVHCWLRCACSFACVRYALDSLSLLWWWTQNSFRFIKIYIYLYPFVKKLTCDWQMKHALAVVSSLSGFIWQTIPFRDEILKNFCVAQKNFFVDCFKDVRRLSSLRYWDIHFFFCDFWLFFKTFQDSFYFCYMYSVLGSVSERKKWRFFPSYLYWIHFQCQFSYSLM